MNSLRRGFGLPALTTAFALLFLLSLLLGRFPRPGLVSPAELLSNSMAFRLLLHLRLPRVITAAFLGMSLAAAGCAFQMLFKNPLVEPGFLGVSQGAAFGAALAILILPGVGGAVPLSALLFSLLGLFGSYAVARRLPFGGWVIRMVISGLAVSALFASGLGILKYVADPASQLQEMTFWMLGGLQSVTWPKTLWMLPFSSIGLLVLLVYRWRLNLLSLDDLTAFSLGSNPARERMGLLLAASLAVAGVTAVAGIVGWLGLLIPHVARRLFGSEGRRVIPASIALGGIMALVCDDLARVPLPYEIPLGIITSLFGAAFFVALLATGGVRIHR